MSGPEPRSLFASDEGRRAGRLLEFSAVLELVAGQCALGRAADVVRDQEPVDDAEWLRRQWRDGSMSSQMFSVFDCSIVTRENWA